VAVAVVPAAALVRGQAAVAAARQRAAAVAVPRRVQARAVAVARRRPRVAQAPDVPAWAAATVADAKA
jgi:hypothetical protein